MHHPNTKPVGDSFGDTDTAAGHGDANGNPHASASHSDSKRDGYRDASYHRYTYSDGTPGNSDCDTVHTGTSHQLLNENARSDW